MCSWKFQAETDSEMTPHDFAQRRWNLNIFVPKVTYHGCGLSLGQPEPMHEFKICSKLWIALFIWLGSQVPNTCILQTQWRTLDFPMLFEVTLTVTANLTLKVQLCWF